MNTIETLVKGVEYPILLEVNTIEGLEYYKISDETRFLERTEEIKQRGPFKNIYGLDNDDWDTICIEYYNWIDNPTIFIEIKEFPKHSLRLDKIIDRSKKTQNEPY
ncbi:MAG: hypothetical protein ACRCZK_01915 [Oscillospiraceae bacterium]